MSVWERIDSNGHGHALTSTEDKRARQRFAAMMDQSAHHVRVGQRRQDGTQITLVGTAAELHGPKGVCTCCPHHQTPQPATAPDPGHIAEAEPRPESERVDTSRAAVKALGWGSAS